MSDPSRTVLYVDDDPDDREIVGTAINEIDPLIKVVHACNGLEAIAYLDQAKEKKDFPCLVILDINMPKMDGKQTLAEIKGDQLLKTLPVVLFSTANNPRDQLYCAHYGVNLVTKPSTLKSIRNEVARLLQHCADA